MDQKNFFLYECLLSVIWDFVLHTVRFNIKTYNNNPSFRFLMPINWSCCCSFRIVKQLLITFFFWFHCVIIWIKFARHFLLLVHRNWNIFHYLMCFLCSRLLALLAVLWPEMSNFSAREKLFFFKNIHIVHHLVWEE